MCNVPLVLYISFATVMRKRKYVFLQFSILLSMVYICCIVPTNFCKQTDTLSGWWFKKKKRGMKCSVQVVVRFVEEWSVVTLPHTLGLKQPAIARATQCHQCLMNGVRVVYDSLAIISHSFTSWTGSRMHSRMALAWFYLDDSCLQQRCHCNKKNATTESKKADNCVVTRETLQVVALFVLYLMFAV